MPAGLAATAQKSTGARHRERKDFSHHKRKARKLGRQWVARRTGSTSPQAVSMAVFIKFR